MNKLVKQRIAAALLLLTATLQFPMAANGQWEETIDTDAPYCVNRVHYDAPVQSGTTDHIIAQGETLTSICRQHNITMAQLLQVNNISNPDLVVVGQRLTIPGATAPAFAAKQTTANYQLPVPAMAWPVAGEMSSPFGIRKAGRPHHGIDIAAPHGANIKAPLAGAITYAGCYGTYGNTVIIDHGAGISSLYAHCSTLLVQAGQQISTGQTIAQVGDTGHSFGPHLHWEVRYQNIPFDPLLSVQTHETQAGL